MIGNPIGTALQKVFAELLQARYGKFKNIIERICANTLTEDDYKSTAELLINVYEMGFLKAVNDHREALKKMGLQARIVQSEKSG